MALITTVAGTTSDSYATVAEADLIVAYRGSAAWTAASSGTKETHLKAAADFLERLDYYGAKSVETQRLRFPSSHHQDAAGVLVVYAHIKRAQSFLAGFLLENPTSFDGAGSDADSVSVSGVFSVSGLSHQGSALPDLVMRELKPEFMTAGATGQGAWDWAGRTWV